MKTLILAGGHGTRLGEETAVRPKPMVEIGGKPILWHIMNIYAAYGFNEFVVALGYKAEMIKQYFLNYHYMQASMTVHLASGRVDVRNGNAEDWLIHLVDTGVHTQTGTRIKQICRWVGPETFMLTYGDGVADIDIRRLLAFHKSHGRLATVTAVRPTSRFGNLEMDGDLVIRFSEKSQLAEGWINGGFFVLEPGIVDYIEDGDVTFERGPMEDLAKDAQLVAFRHNGFWQCMDTLRDVKFLNSLWDTGNASWLTPRQQRGRKGSDSILARSKSSGHGRKRANRLVAR
jgi:glucose-1-phosphate cytidylyltransferase